jgi:hypothetical protein
VVVVVVVVREARMSVDDARPFDSIEFCTEWMRYDTQTQGTLCGVCGRPLRGDKDNTVNATMIRKLYTALTPLARRPS